VTGTDISAAEVRSALAKLWAANVDISELYAVVSSKDALALLSDTTLANYFAFSNTQAIKNAEVGDLYGSNIKQSNLVPVVAGSPASTKNLMLTPDAFIMAMRGLPTDGGVGVDQQNYQDPVSGLTLRMTTSYSANNLGVQVTFDVLYGVAILRNVAGVVMLG
jgi:hypothetical protein